MLCGLQHEAKIVYGEFKSDIEHMPPVTAEALRALKAASDKLDEYPWL
jgi:hypothetical protein